MDEEDLELTDYDEDEDVPDAAAADDATDDGEFVQEDENSDEAHDQEGSSASSPISSASSSNSSAVQRRKKASAGAGRRSAAALDYASIDPDLYGLRRSGRSRQTTSRFEEVRFGKWWVVGGLADRVD